MWYRCFLFSMLYHDQFWCSFCNRPYTFCLVAWDLVYAIAIQGNGDLSARFFIKNNMFRLWISLYGYPTCHDCFEKIPKRHFCSSITNINFLAIQNHLHDDSKCKFFIPFIHFSEWADMIQLLIDMVCTTHM